MDRHALVRWAGSAAIAGGTLRGVTALLPAAQTPAIHLTYLTIDLLLPLAAIVVGALSLGVAALQTLFVVSGLLLAAGFIGTGLYLYTTPDRVPQDELRT